MKNREQPIRSIGIIADLQYCDAEPEHNRFFRFAPTKLSQSLTELNSYDLDFIVNLGDTIDHDWKSFDGIMPHFKNAKAPVFHVLGNHDYEIEDEYKSQVHEKLGIPRYYYKSMNKWRFIFLDGNEISTYANIKGSSNYYKAEDYLGLNKINSNFWNGGIGIEQIEWLKENLRKAEKADEKVIIFCHFPIYPSHRHNLLNDDELLHVIENFAAVKAWICGHNHDGNYGMYRDIHFINMKGMVDTEQQLAFGILNLSDDYIVMQGFGNEVSARLNI